MDTMAIQILEKLILTRKQSINLLVNELELSKGQIQYRIKQLNQELALSGLGKINKDGKYLELETDRKQVRKFLKTVSPEVYLSEKERMFYLYFIVLLFQGETLVSIGDRMNVSKNTALKNKNKLQEKYLTALKLELAFNRKKGFYLKEENLTFVALAYTRLMN